MRDKVLNDRMISEIDTLIKQSGFALVELKTGVSRNLVNAEVVIYRAEGVGTDDLAYISRMIHPHLELISENLALTVSSPGINRILKSAHEYSIFRGRGVRVLLKDETEWLGGIIKGVESGILSLLTCEGFVDIDISRIRRAKLDYSQEVDRLKNVC